MVKKTLRNTKSFQRVKHAQKENIIGRILQERDEVRERLIFDRAAREPFQRKKQLSKATKNDWESIKVQPLKSQHVGAWPQKQHVR